MKTSTKLSTTPCLAICLTQAVSSGDSSAFSRVSISC